MQHLQGSLGGAQPSGRDGALDPRSAFETVGETFRCCFAKVVSVALGKRLPYASDVVMVTLKILPFCDLQLARLHMNDRYGFGVGQG